MRFPEFTGAYLQTTIGNLTTKVGSGITPKGGDSVYTTEGHPFVRSQNVGYGNMLLKDIAYIDNQTHQKQLSTEIKKGDVLLNITGASIGRSCVASNDVIGGNVNQHVCIIRPNEKVLTDYLCCLLLSDKGQKQIDSFQAGGNRQGLNYEQIKSFRFSIPTIQEQTKVSSLLSLINERIATQSRAIEDLKRLRLAIQDKLIEQLVCSNDLKSFSEVYEVAGEGGTPDTSKREYYEGGTIPFIKIDDLANKYLKEHKDSITELGMCKSSAWLVPANSLIFSNGATIGSASINSYPVATKQGVLGIVPKNNISVEYLYYLMTSTYFKKQVHRIITHGTMATAYLRDINKIAVPIPNIDKQKYVSLVLSSLSRKEDIEIQMLCRLQNQKQYLLQRMFI